MLASITPLGERARSRRWGVTAGFYTAGSVLGGAASGAAAGAVGEVLDVPGTLALALAAAACAVGVAVDLGVGGLRLPTVRRQVEENWLAGYRGWVVGLGFGTQLGLGVVTIVSTAGVYVTLALALLTGSVPAGVGLGAVFGLARALPLLAVRGVRSPAALAALHRRVGRLERAGRRVATGVLAAAGVLAALAAGAAGAGGAGG
jgi:hypothetical protein